MDISKYSQNATRQYQTLFYYPTSRSAAGYYGYVGFVSQLTRGIDSMAE